MFWQKQKINILKNLIDNQWLIDRKKSHLNGFVNIVRWSWNLGQQARQACINNSKEIQKLFVSYFPHHYVPLLLFFFLNYSTFEHQLFLQPKDLLPPHPNCWSLQLSPVKSLGSYIQEKRNFSETALFFLSAMWPTLQTLPKWFGKPVWLLHAACLPFKNLF